MQVLAATSFPTLLAPGREVTRSLAVRGGQGSEGQALDPDIEIPRPGDCALSLIKILPTPMPPVMHSLEHTQQYAAKTHHKKTRCFRHATNILKRYSKDTQKIPN